MAEDKTFRYGLIVLGFFLVMIGMFIMSVDKPHVYITFCSMGVFMICIGITWSICQCYPKITFTPVDMEYAALTEKSSVFGNNGTPEKPWSTTHYTTSKEAERYETSLPSYEQIEKKVEGPAEPEGDHSVPPFLQHTLLTCSKSKLQAKVEIHRNSDSTEENKEGTTAGTGDLGCQSDRPKVAPLAFLKDDTGLSSDDSRSSRSSVQSCDALQKVGASIKQSSDSLGDPYSGDGITLIDSPVPSYESTNLHLEKDRNATSPTIQQDAEYKASQPLFVLEPPGESEMDDMYYGLKDEPDNMENAGESDVEQ
uniref:Barttin CLCNK type accessory subunit beta n=1 Tax=Leptobrachium leishanense TaxID=445787 RepID=A0A8C5R8K2_9ANUR